MMHEREGCCIEKTHTIIHTHTHRYICIYIWCEWRERQAAKQKLKKFRDTMDAQIVEREIRSRERERQRVAEWRETTKEQSDLQLTEVLNTQADKAVVFFFFYIETERSQYIELYIDDIYDSTKFN